MTANPWVKSFPWLLSPLCIIEPIIHIAKFAMSAAVVMAIFCSHLFGQSGAASIQGKVTDSTGAVVVGASVSILNQETGLAVEAKTRSVGFYWVPSLFKGRYIYPTPICEAYRNVSGNNPCTVGYGKNYNSVQYTPSNNYLLISAPNRSSSYCWRERLLDWLDTAAPLTWHD